MITECLFHCHVEAALSGALAPGPERVLARPRDPTMCRGVAKASTVPGPRPPVPNTGHLCSVCSPGTPGDSRGQLSPRRWQARALPPTLGWERCWFHGDISAATRGSRPGFVLPPVPSAPHADVRVSRRPCSSRDPCLLWASPAVPAALQASPLPPGCKAASCRRPPRAPLELSASP